MKCPKCDYEWATKSTRKYVTCPNCMRKVLNVQKVDDQEEETQ